MTGKRCKNNPEKECCGGHCHEHKEADVSSLGPEAVELAKMFDEVNANLVNALAIRKKIIETVHTRSLQSKEMKEKMEKVLSTRHPVLMQFVFGSKE